MNLVVRWAGIAGWSNPKVRAGRGVSAAAAVRLRVQENISPDEGGRGGDISEAAEVSCRKTTGGTGGRPEEKLYSGHGASPEAGRWISCGFGKG